MKQLVHISIEIVFASLGLKSTLHLEMLDPCPDECRNGNKQLQQN